MALAAADPKGQLNQFLQKKVGRSLLKDDITYAATKHGNEFQATVSIACLGGTGFRGELQATKKLAEAAAAQQALKHFEGEIPTVMAEPKQKNTSKRPASAVDDGSSGPPVKMQKVNGQQQSVGPKMELNEICVKIIKRSLAKGDVVYTSQQVAGGFQSTLQLVCLPGVYGQSSFTGGVAGNKKESENAVATIALETLKSDIEFAEVLNKQKPSGKEESAQKSESGESNKKKKKGNKKARSRVSTERVSGTFEGWKGNTGWIKPSEPFEHEKANMHGGKIYLNKSDAPEDTEMNAGITITFHVYVDNAGLGAEDVEM